jgi:hypothetical protein
MMGVCSQLKSRHHASRLFILTNARCHIAMSSDMARYTPAITIIGNHASIGIAHSFGPERYLQFASLGFDTRTLNDCIVPTMNFHRLAVSVPGWPFA